MSWPEWNSPFATQLVPPSNDLQRLKAPGSRNALSLGPAVPTMQRQSQVTFPPIKPLATTFSSITAQGLLPRKHHRTHSSSSFPISPPHYSPPAPVPLHSQHPAVSALMSHVLDAGEEIRQAGEPADEMGQRGPQTTYSTQKDLVSFCSSVAMLVSYDSV